MATKKLELTFSEERAIWHVFGESCAANIAVDAGLRECAARAVLATNDSITEELFVQRAQLAFQDVRRQLDKLTKRSTTKKGAR